MFSMFCYVIAYYNIASLFQYWYLPFALSFIPNNTKIEYLSSNVELYFLLKITSYFMLLLYGYDLINRILFYGQRDKNSIGLSFIYLKYISNIILCPNITMTEYEMDRIVMWAFTTPLMIKMLSDENNLTVIDLKMHYHAMAIVPHIFCIPFKNTNIYFLSTIVLSIPGLVFINSLKKYKHMHFTNLFILIWGIFMCINAIDIARIFDPNIIHAFYNLADTLFKFIFNFVISSYNEQEMIVRENMDLQSVNFISHVIKSIKDFENSNKIVTPFCKSLIFYCKKNFLDKIPKTNVNLKLELLKKILPFDLDRDYINLGPGPGSGSGPGPGPGPGPGSGSSVNKQFNFICIMFMDIVNYTDLANRYDGDIIFKLLDDVYSHFDSIIKKYSLLQKIETIGDAYMVVGDIYRSELNYKETVREIILLGLEFIQEVKKIKTPDNIPLSIRVGINIGTVNVGFLGSEIPRLCVVGNAVNKASRLQSTADEDSIQLSHHVYEQACEIDFGFPMIYKTKEHVFLKNIGSVTTYNICPQNK